MIQNKSAPHWLDLVGTLALVLLAGMGLSSRFMNVTWMASFHPTLGLIIAPLVFLKNLFFINLAKKIGADSKTNSRKMALILLVTALCSGVAYAMGFGNLLFHQVSVVLAMILEIGMCFSKSESVLP